MDPEKDSKPTSDEENGNHVEAVRTISKVPGNEHYYEKNGLRTEGDGEDHVHEPPLTLHRFMILLGLAFLWTGSQIPVYLYGGIYPIIVDDIGGADRYVWILLGNLVPLATVTPFVGALSDLFGRRNLAIGGSVLLIVGNTVCATAHVLNTFIGGQVLNGIGAGILELTALAAAGEIAPTSKRGIYVGSIILTILPFAPSVLYAQLISFYSSWRYVGLLNGLWAAIGLILIAIFYFPPPRVNMSGLSRKDVGARIDYVGGLLSCAGLTLFLAGLTWGGNQYPWTSAHTLAPLIIGLVLLIGFAVWELYFVKYPMFPGRLKTNPRALYVVLIITFVSGANFFSVLIFWPIQYYDVYADGGDPVSIGIGSLPVGFCILGGSVVVAFALTILKGKVRALMIISCIVMAAGNGGIACARQDNLMVVYAPVVFACLGVGAVIIPNQIIATIVCPDDLIATVTALTISVRIIGGAIGFAIYYNILRSRFQDHAILNIGIPAVEAGFTTYNEIYQLGYLLGANLRGTILEFPQITEQNLHIFISAAQKTFAQSFPDVYYASIAFGAVSVIASFFLPDLSPFMDDHIAVQMH